MDSYIGGIIAAGGVSGGVVAVMYMAWKIFKHSRCKSSCCGKDASMSIDLDKGFETRKDVPTQTPTPVLIVKD